MQLVLLPKVKASLSKVRVSRLTARRPQEERVIFDLKAEIKEATRTDSGWLLRYLLAVDTFPMVLRAEMEGLAELELPGAAGALSLEEMGETVWSDMAVQIFRQNFELFHLVLDTMGFDSPSPWLVREVRLLK
jgi:hypothetical protein